MKKKFCIALDNIRSAQNVGSILRSAESFGADKVFLIGITPDAGSPKVKKTSLGAEKNLHIYYEKDAASLLKKLKRQGVGIVSLEITDRSKDINDFDFKNDSCLFLGNEVSGVSDEILLASDQVLKIPMIGKKESLNVAVSAGIAAYVLQRRNKTLM